MGIQLTINTIIQRNDVKYLANALGEETVLMNLDSGDYLGINNIGSDIWKLLGTPISIQDLLKDITDIYNISEEDCTDDVIAFLNNMIEQDMITVQTL